MIIKLASDSSFPTEYIDRDPHPITSETPIQVAMKYGRAESGEIIHIWLDPDINHTDPTWEVYWDYRSSKYRIHRQEVWKYVPPKTTKVMDISEGGISLEVIRINNRKEPNPYRIYLKYWNGGKRRRQINKYGDFMSCLYFIRDMYKEGCNAMPMCEQIDWAKEYCTRGYTH